mmetsp:Transcript_3380/g.5182  ORF Transcript_3380/g.5182 Transcript_3380/m.5182 type:complete len:338 (-) Transcript_3380:101-1114(-)
MCASLLLGIALLTSLTASFAPTAISLSRHRPEHYRTYPRISSTTSDGDFDIDTAEDDLTKEELLLRLSEVRSYYRGRPEEGMTQVAICLKLLSTRLQNLHLNRSFVATSTIPNAGYGLFASRDINDGELITLYPGDAVFSFGQVGAEGEEKSAGTINSIMFGAHTKPEQRDINRVMTHEARGYEMEISTCTSIVGDPLIGFSDAAYIAHYANDGGYLTDFGDSGRKAYQKETLERYNAANFVLEGAHMGTVATKLIERGSEVFISYGEGYWLSRSDSDLAGKERANILVEIESNMDERRKIKRATTLTSSGVGRGTAEKGSNKKSKKKKNKKKKRKS